MLEVRLIDANALKAKLKIGTNTATYSDYCNGYCDARQVDLDAIDAAPTIDAEPVRHGRWIFGSSKTSCWMKCSVCCKAQIGQTATFSYCPNCGARMDGPPEKE